MSLFTRLPLTDAGIQPFIEQLPAEMELDGVETSASILDDDSGWEDLLDAYDVQLVSMHSLLPVHVSRYLAEAGDLARKALLGHAELLLVKAAACGVDYVSMDLAAERVVDTDLESNLALKAEMLRTLIPVLERLSITLTISCRSPAMTPTEGGDNAVELVRLVGHPRVRLALNVYPAELGRDFDVASLVKPLQGMIGIFRWHYEPQLGDRPTRGLLASFRETLASQGFPGIVVICPRVDEPAAFAREMGRFSVS